MPASSPTPTTTSAGCSTPRGARGTRRHAGLRDHRRQRRQRRRVAARHHQRGLHDQPHERDRGRGVRRGAHRGPRHALVVQPLCGGLGACHGHAVPVDQAGGLALGRHPQRHHRQLALRHRSPRRDPPPVRARHRCRADSAGGGRHPRAGDRARCHAAALRGDGDELLVQRCGRRGAARHAVLRDGRQPGDLPQGWTAVAKHKDPWLPSTHGLDEDVWELYDIEADWTQSHDLAAEEPERLAHLQQLFLIQPPGSTCCRWTSVRRSGSTPTSPAGRR